MRLKRSLWGGLIITSALLGAIFGSSYNAQAATTTPTILNFQGRLTDASGAPMIDGKYNMRFRAYLNNPTGGTATWTETHDGTANRVEVKNGVFSTNLGVISPFSSSAFAGYTIYIEVELPTPATAQCDGTPATNCSPSWTEGAMTPRQPIAAQGYAMNADLIDGIDGVDLAQLSASGTYSGATVFRPSSDSTTAFQIQKSDSTPLLVADTQNLALKIGGGDVSPDASPALLVLDYKNSTGDPTGTNGAMYYNDATGTYRCFEDNAWKDCLNPELASIQGAYNYKQDMMYNTAVGANTTLNLDSTISAVGAGTGSGISIPASEQNYPGIWRFSTGTTTTGSTFITSSRTSGSLFTPYRIGEGEWTLSTGVRITTADVAAATNRYGFYFGLTTVAYSTNGCLIRYIYTDYLGDWAGYCGNGTTETKCDITDGGSAGLRPMVAGTWYHLKIKINAAGTLATFIVNDAYSCSIGTDIPTATNLGIRLGIIKVAGTTARTADIDYLDFTYNTPNR